MKTGLVLAAEEFVQREVAAYDASHDWSHVDRVRTLTLAIAAEEARITYATHPDECELMELCALLHDVADWKYSGSEDAGPQRVTAFLRAHGYPADRIARVDFVLRNMGFKNELNRTGEQAQAHEEGPLEWRIVQDADRLDAMGAIGIARCMCYTGAKRRPLHNPAAAPRQNLTKEQYCSTEARDPSHDTAINHFHEKLLTLRDRMRTAAGRRLAEGRHAFMLAYLEQFDAEWAGQR